jgi:uncharacterized membrane protein
MMPEAATIYTIFDWIQVAFIVVVLFLIAERLRDYYRAKRLKK